MPIRPRTPPKPRTGFLRHWTLWAWFVLAMALTLGGVCLWRSGRWLVHADAFGHVKWALVLAGDSRDCERTDAAIRLFQEGRIDTLILSGCRIFKDRYQSEFLADYAVRQGVPRDRVFEFRQDTYSTQEEARLLVRQFRLQNLDTVLVITTNYHTARARRIFRKLAQGYPVVLVAAADYPLYDPAAWWSNRESRKLWFGEWMKTFYTAFEMWGARPEGGKAEYQGLTPDPWGGGGSAPPAAALDTVSRAADSAALRGAEKAEGGKDKPKNGADSLKAAGRAAAAEDSARARKDTAQGASAGAPREEGKGPEAQGSPGTEREAGGKGKDEAKSEARAGKDSAEAARPGEAARAGAEPARAESKAAHAGSAPRETAKEAEARKAAHAARKPPAAAPKPAPRHEDKKAEKPKKKG